MDLKKEFHDFVDKINEKNEMLEAKNNGSNNVIKTLKDLLKKQVEST